MPEYLLDTNYIPITANSGVAYKILDNLGRGGNGEVHLVIAKSGDNRGLLFALKLFRRINDATRLQRFNQEVDLLNALNHPSLLKIVDSGTLVHDTGDYPFVVFEYLPQTLADALRTGLSMVEKASFTLQLISALCYLGSQDPQIIHRDIKPENIFVRGRSCILGDFGLIKIVGADVPDGDHAFFVESIGVIMPWGYRTPDLVDYCSKQVELTVKSDVFQLGLVIAEIFSGHNPLKPAENRLDPIELFPSIFPFGGSYYEEINARVQEMLQQDPNARPLISDLVEPWDGIFRGMVALSMDLEGSAFP